MADRIYGIRQSQPHDVFAYIKQRNAFRGISGQIVYLPNYAGNLDLTQGQTIVITGDVDYHDVQLMDGRVLRYQKITAFAVTYGTYGASQIDTYQGNISNLGYDEIITTTPYVSIGDVAVALGVPVSRMGTGFSGAEAFSFLAGTPRYVGTEATIEDVPNDGVDCVRVNGRWQPIDLSAYETIQGSQDRVDAAIGSTFNGRNILLTSDTSVFADGEGAVSDPTGGAGWYYTNTQGNKINWYFYSGGSDSESLGALQAADGGYYMVIDARNNTSWPYLIVYTSRQNDGNDASWYRSRLVYGPGGNYSNQLTQGLHVCHTPNLAQSVKDGLAVKFPTATFTELGLDPISTVGPQENLEDLWLIAVSTSSNEPASQEAFVLRENALFFGGKARSWQYAAIPTQQPEYSNYYKGAYAQEADYPESGALGQWIINSTDDTMLVWDVEGGGWTATGSTAAPATATVNDYPFQYVYSSLDGSGYGFENAFPAAQWQNTPDGKLQATGGSSDILGRRVKFATLKNPGDEVTVQASGHSGAYGRYTIIGLTAGTDADSLSWKVAGQPSSGTTWMMTEAADRDLVEFYTAYMEPYWGGTTYGYNLTSARNSTGYGYTGNAGELPITFRVNDDYHIEMYIDGTYFVRTLNVPTNGVDLYYTIYGNTGRVFEQPTGNGANFVGGTAPNATGAKYYMSDAAPTRPEATLLASGGGFSLYSDTEASGTGYNVELTSSEAGAARYARVFTDYSGMTLSERADATYPIVKQDEAGLNRVEYLARGYFHSLDLNVAEIQEKMNLYADALAAATAGSVEVCLGALQSLTIPTPASSGTVAYDPNYVFQGSSYDNSYENYYSGDSFYDTYGIDQVEISSSFITVHFKDSASFNAWRSQDRTITLGCTDGSSYSWEGVHTLDAAAEYSASSQYNYIHYQPSTTSASERESLADKAANIAMTPVISIAFDAVAPASPADALGETAVVAELITLLQTHLQKFPR